MVVCVLAAAVAAAAEPTSGPARPAAPAFYTVSIGRVRNIQADCFEFERDDRKRTRVRLACADTLNVPDRIRGMAETIVRNILETGPVWVFPCGSPKDRPEEVWADVWTPKGWLSERLIRAGYAMRRKDLDVASLTAFDPTGTTTEGPVPADPAFASARCAPSGGDTFEVDRAGKKVRVRLFYVTCQGLDQPAAADAAAQKCAGDDPVWVFPCCPAKAGEDARVRVWTRRGWMATELLKQKLATRYDDPFKAEIQTASATPPPTPKPTKDPDTGTTPDPGTTPTKTSSGKPGDPEFTWREVTVPKGKADSLSCESGTFAVTSELWRISWTLKPVRVRGPINLNVYRVDEKWNVKTSSAHVTAFKGQTGAKYVRAKPGQFWVRVTGSNELVMKVEEAVPVE
ncbi:MAG TPA: hypothetical protein VM431_12545 [Phycisphaerae bacterium]|nr:hypothetical protein [Phycisphaerae bacterium]